MRPSHKHVQLAVSDLSSMIDDTADAETKLARDRPRQPRSRHMCSPRMHTDLLESGLMRPVASRCASKSGLKPPAAFGQSIMVSVRAERVAWQRLLANGVSLRRLTDD